MLALSRDVKLTGKSTTGPGGDLRSDLEELEASRIAAIEHVGAVRPETDGILQQLVDDVRGVFGADLCVVHLMLPNAMYFRAWSGPLPDELAASKLIPKEMSMCPPVVEGASPLVVEDLIEADEYKEHFVCAVGGMRFYAGTPLLTSEGVSIGTLCLLDGRPKRFTAQQLTTLGAFARAVSGRLELLGALERERDYREEEARRAREVARILESITDAFFALDGDWRFAYVNSEAERLLNRPKEQLLSENMWEQFPEAVGSTFYRKYHNAMEMGATAEFEEYYAPLDTWFAVRAYPSEGGLSVYFSDINDRKRAEGALRESEEKYRRLVETVQEGIAYIGPHDGIIDYCNLAYAEILGSEPGDLVGKSFFDFLDEGQKEKALRERTLRLRGAGTSYEICVTAADGRKKNLSATGSPLFKPDGSYGGAVQTIVDVTERKELEANQQRFLANAAHQLKTPITAVVGAAELLATKKDADPAVKDRLLSHILAEGARMRRLADTLLRLARVGRDSREPNVRGVDLGGAVRQAVARMEPLATSAGLVLRAAGEGAKVHADPEWLQELLLVLLSNAIKHSRRGEDITVRAVGTTAVVEDKGTGISREDLPHVFERFYRGDDSEGFGLGLSICRELTERMGGSISVRSREGAGTSVTVELPEAGSDA